MRIAMISTPFVAVPPASYGGTELVVATLARSLVERGHDVVVYATGDSTVAAPVRSLYERAVWPPDTYRELNHVLFAVEDIIRSDDFDVVHAHAAPALAFRSLLDLPLVYTVHHTLDPALSELYARTARSPNVTVVAISDRQRAMLADACSAEVVHHGLDPADFPLGAGRGGYAAFVGRFAEVKGPHTAVDIARRAGVRLRMGGRHHPADAAYFHDVLEAKLREPGVEWVGEVSHDPKVKLLGDALVTLFPIDWEEPFGLVMIESMLCGTPVLAFPRGSAPEVIDEGVTGWLVADEQEMAWRLARVASGRDSVDRARCQAHAARRFSADRMVDDYLDVYERAMARAGVAPAAGLTRGLLM